MYIFLDLENMTWLAQSLQPLAMVAIGSFEFRAYSSPEFEWADRAMHHSHSNEKEAADVRMVCDAARLLQQPNARLLLVTNDLFGRTLAAEESQVDHVGWSDPLPPVWRKVLRNAGSIEAFYAPFKVYRERVSRAASVKSGRLFTRRSWSRAASVIAPGVAHSRRQRLLEAVYREVAEQTGRPPAYDEVSQIARPDRSDCGVSDDEDYVVRQPRISPPSRPSTRSRARAKGPRKWPIGQKPSTGKEVGTIKRWFDAGYGFISPAAVAMTSLFTSRTSASSERRASGSRFIRLSVGMLSSRGLSGRKGNSRWSK